MASDPRIPGVQLKEGEQIDQILKWHGIVYFRLVHLLLIPFFITLLKAKNALMVVTNQRVIVQGGVISKEQTKLDLLKIQDITCGVKGLIPRIAGAGYIQIETASSSGPVLFWPVANYQSAADRVSELMDQAKKNEQMAMARNIAAGMKGESS